MSNLPSQTLQPQTIEYYKSLTPDQIKIELEKWEDIYKLSDLNQYTLKILMNSSYGSLSLTSNPFSAYGVLGSSITSTGRFYNRWVAYRVNEFLNNILNMYTKEELLGLPFTIQGDTDTVGGDSIIYLEDKKTSIKDFFESCIYDFEEHTKSGKHIKHINNRYNCLSLNNKFEKEFKDVRYVMAHEVEKKYYKIRVRNDEVVITEDHSIMVVRDGKLIEIKPKDIKNTDKFIRLKNNVSDNILDNISNDLDFVSNDNCEIIDLGICKETVYDIEVQDNHNFFANNILVHNSSYNLLEQICDKFVPQATAFERLIFAQEYFDANIMPVIKEAINEVSYTLNVRHPEVMKMDQETTTSAFISVAPKRYYLRNHYKEIEGQIVIQPIDKPKLKITGLSIVGKSTPSWSKKRLKPLMELILDKNEKEMAQYVNDIKKEIYNADLISVCQFKNVSKVSFDLFEDNKFYRYSDNGNLTTVGGHGKGALWYNKFVFDNQLTSKYSYIKAGDIVKVLPIYKDNPLIPSDTIAFTDIKFITETGFNKYIDYDALFDKIFVSNVNIILKPLKWEIYNVEEDLMSAWGF